MRELRPPFFVQSYDRFIEILAHSLSLTAKSNDDILAANVAQR